MASLVVVALLSWILGRAVMGVYWVVIDCVMMCFFYDHDKDHCLPVSDRIRGRWRSKKILADTDSDEGDHAAEGHRRRADARKRAV